MAFKKATKFESKLRMALAGPSGSGKTFTALTLAHALADGQGVAVIDTERGSASKYADAFPEFDVAELENFHPNNYIQSIREAEQAGYAVLVIDSLSHAWNGPGGLLELVEAVTKRSNNKSSFNAWSEATPLQNRLIDTITRSKMHIIVTMRTKTEYVVEQNERGKSAPRKVGTAPVQRADVEYEFDVYADLDVDNTLIVHKSRCSALAGAVIAKPDASVAKTLKSWLQGAPAPVPATPTAPVNAPQPSNGSTQQPAPREAKATEPVPPPKATEQQISSIRKLCQALKESEPENIEQLAYFAAKKLLDDLLAKYKAQKAASQNQQTTAPAASQPANGAAKALQDMIARAKVSVDALPGDFQWDIIKRDALDGKPVEDKDLTVQQVVEINKIVALYEKEMQSQAKAS